MNPFIAIFIAALVGSACYIVVSLTKNGTRKLMKLLKFRLLLCKVNLTLAFRDLCIAVGEAEELYKTDPELAQQLSSLQNQLW